MGLASGQAWREVEGVRARLEPGALMRMVARASEWWQGGRSLPDRREARVEFGDRRVLGAECRPREPVQEVGPGPGFAGGEAVAGVMQGPWEG